MATRESLDRSQASAVEPEAPVAAAAGLALRAAGEDRAATARFGVVAGIFGTTATAACAATANSVAMWAALTTTALHLLAVLTAG